MDLSLFGKKITRNEVSIQNPEVLDGTLVPIQTGFPVSGGRFLRYLEYLESSITISTTRLVKP